jgi:uncharacterized membrane protein
MADADPPLSAQELRKADPDRVLTFTDGVFAIIITILVLELEVPDLSSGQSLRASLEEMRPTFMAFVVSFLLVGMYWVWHRDVFTGVRYVNRDLVWLNLLFLLPASMIPFAASVLGEYSTDATALHLYGAVLIAVTLMRVVIDWYLRHHPGLLWDPGSRQSRRIGSVLAAAPLVVYVLAMAVAAWQPALSMILYFSLPLLYFAFVAFLSSDPRTRQATEDAS